MKIYNVSQEDFMYLENTYGFKILSKKAKNWGFEIIYKNQTTAVEITYEYRESNFFIKLYGLVDNIFIRNPGVISKNTTLYGYSLNDIINIRNPEALIKPGYEYEDNHKYHNKTDGILLYVKDVADNLREYTEDILLGDFTIFYQLDRIVKNRINEII